MNTGTAKDDFIVCLFEKGVGNEADTVRIREPSMILQYFRREQ